MARMISRRDMLRFMGLGGSATLLAACQPKVVEKIVKETVVVEKEKVVEKVVKEAVEVEKEVTRVVEQVVEKTVVVEKARELTGEVSIWFSYGDKSGGGLGMANLEEKFNEMYPGVTTKMVYGANQDKWLPALAAGNPPDVLLIFVDHLTTLAHRGALMDITPFIERDGIDMDVFWPIALKQTSWKDRYYAIIHHPHAWVLWYNSAAMKEVGLDPKQPAQNWDDLYDWGMQLSKKDGDDYTRLGYYPIQGFWAAQHIYGNGGDLVAEDGHTCVIESLQTEEALEWVNRVVTDVCGGYENISAFLEANPAPTGQKNAYWVWPWGVLGMMYQGNWVTNSIRTQNPEMEWEAGKYPGGPQNEGNWTVLSGSHMMALPVGAKNWELGWEFLKLLASPDGSRAVMANTEDICGRMDVAKDPELVAQHLGREKMLDIFESATRVDTPWHPITMEINAEVTRMGERFLTGEMPVKQALSEAQKRIQDALDDFWATA